MHACAATLCSITDGPRLQKLLRDKLEAKLRRRVPPYVKLADFYHASRSADEREAVQRAWMAGETLILAATVAFGMGIDKADVRRLLVSQFLVQFSGPLHDVWCCSRSGKWHTH